MNPNLFVVTSDWHVGKITQAHALEVAQYIASLDPAGVIDLGDCKETHDGTDTSFQLDSYVAAVKNVIPWATVRPGANAQLPILPGNHDDRYSDLVLPTDYSLFNAKMWGPPYHWSCDWAAPKIRWIGFHTRIVKQGDVLPAKGMGAAEVTESLWVASEIDSMPEGWQAIVCSHFPLATAFGNYIGKWPGYGGAEMETVIRDRSSRVCAYVNGHRHANMNTVVVDGVKHFNGPSVAYTAGNGYGALSPVDYDHTLRTLTFRLLLGQAPAYPPFAGYVPVVVQLPALTVPDPLPPDPPETYSFDGVLDGDGPMSGATIAGTITI